MMSIDLPDQAPLFPRAAQKPTKRPTPCAGLFGWRKDEDDKSGKRPNRDHPFA